jgi:ribonucleoside-diphosphate reductase alpha chain
VFDFHYQRRVLERDGTTRTEQVEDYAHALYRTRFGAAAPLTDAFVTAEELTPRAHLEMQAAVQAHVDSSISKTINCPANLSFEAFEDVYLQAYDLGLKGCTTYRPNAITGAVLSRANPSADAGVGASAGPPGASSRTPDAASESPRPAVPNEPTHVPAKASAPRRPVEAAAGQAGVVYMAEPLKREVVLEGATYKLRWPSNDHALYITINDIERDGRRRPFEVFINTKNLEHYAWTVALTRMISAIFRRGGDVTFVVEELKAIFDPQGGQWMGSRYVPSLIAAIGEVIEGHMIRIGFLSGVDAGREPDGDAGPSIDQEHLPLAAGDISPPAPTQQRAGGRTCPRCNMRSLHRREGCWICDACGYSRCG